jgi:hypothetical protein
MIWKHLIVQVTAGAAAVTGTIHSVPGQSCRCSDRQSTDVTADTGRTSQDDVRIQWNRTSNHTGQPSPGIRDPFSGQFVTSSPKWDAPAAIQNRNSASASIALSNIKDPASGKTGTSGSSSAVRPRTGGDVRNTGPATGMYSSGSAIGSTSGGGFGGGSGSGTETGGGSTSGSGRRNSTTWSPGRTSGGGGGDTGGGSDVRRSGTSSSTVTTNDLPGKPPRDNPPTNNPPKDNPPGDGPFCEVKPPTETIPGPCPRVPGENDKPVILPPHSGQNPGDTPVVPEPGSILLLAIGEGLGGVRWWRHRKQVAQG